MDQEIKNWSCRVKPPWRKDKGLFWNKNGNKVLNINSALDPIKGNNQFRVFGRFFIVY